MDKCGMAQDIWERTGCFDYNSGGYGFAESSRDEMYRLKKRFKAEIASDQKTTKIKDLDEENSKESFKAE